MKYNKTIKSIMALILCAFITISGIGVQTAFAAGKKVPLKVGFNGKSVILMEDLKTYKRGEVNVSSVEKKWGKPKITKNSDITTYTWKKGKTVIKVDDWHVEKKGGIGGVRIDIKDKNGSLWGIKVGMKKAAALKKVQKLAGKKNALVVKDGQSVESENGSHVVVDTPTGKGEAIWIFFGDYMPIVIDLKNGKVSCISWIRH